MHKCILYLALFQVLFYIGSKTSLIYVKWRENLYILNNYATIHLCDLGSSSTNYNCHGLCCKSEMEKSFMVQLTYSMLYLLSN